VSGLSSKYLAYQIPNESTIICNTNLYYVSCMLWSGALESDVVHLLYLVALSVSAARLGTKTMAGGHTVGISSLKSPRCDLSRVFYSDASTPVILERIAL
jgi:hypothetical protein